MIVGQLSQPLLGYVGQRIGGPIEASTLPLDLLLGDSVSREPPKAGTCGLNSNGMPLQLCVSVRRGGTAMVLIGDPCADLEDSRVRQRESVACAWRLLAHTGCEELGSAFQATLQTMLPGLPVEQDGRRMGVLWLGVDVRKPAFSLYTCPSWDGDVGAGWQRVERWLDEVLPDQRPARRVLERIRSIASPECACIEGLAPNSGRAKIYFRLLRAVRPNVLRILRLDNAEVGAFLDAVVGPLTLHLRAIVFGVSFRLDSGVFADAKLDLCGHCLPRPRDTWQSVLRSLGEQLEIDATDAVGMLAQEGIELACIGIGQDRLGAIRLNTYGRPVRPSGVPMATSVRPQT